MFNLLRWKKGMTSELCQLIEYCMKNIFWKNHAEKVHQKLAPDSFLFLVNNPKQPLQARNFKNDIF